MAGAYGPADATLTGDELAAFGGAHPGAEALFAYLLDFADLTRVMHGYLLGR
jgi:hypothetical protein